MTSKRLLIVDDDKYVLDILGRFFATYGYIVHTAETCAAALQLSRLHRPDCLLLDFHLKDGKGDGVCREIRSDIMLKDTPIIMLSVDPSRELNSYLDYQADSFILKGGSLEKIRAVVESVLRRVRWERRILAHGDIYLTGHDGAVYKDFRLIAKLSGDQFSLLFLLVKNAGEYIGDEVLVEKVMQDNPTLVLDKDDAIRSLVYRLRKKLGPRLALRVQSRKNRGWVYVQPRDRGKERRPSGEPAGSAGEEARTSGRTGGP